MFGHDDEDDDDQDVEMEIDEDENEVSPERIPGGDGVNGAGDGDGPSRRDATGDNGVQSAGDGVNGHIRAAGSITAD